MSERILKLQSEQNFAEVALPGAFTQKLADFRIPASGMTYDLSRSYISLNMEVQCLTQFDTNGVKPLGTVADDTALFNNDIAFDAGSGNKHLASNSQIIRNADMISSSRGMVESIRRVNTLKNVLWNLENDSAEMRNGLDKSGVFQGRRGANNTTSTLIQNIGQNVVDGNIDTSMKASSLSRDFTIPLSDLFGVGSSLWNSNYFSETRIHLELQPNSLVVEQLGGSEETSLFTGQGQNANYGDMLSYDATNLGTFPVSSGLGLPGSDSQNPTPLISKLTYPDAGLDFPFYVGQSVSCTFTSSGALAPVATGNIIESIEYVTPAVKERLESEMGMGPTGSIPVGGVAMTFRQAIVTSAATGANLLTGIKIKAQSSQVASTEIVINRAELVLTEVDTEGPMGMDYTTYSTEETQGHAGLLNLNQQIMVEPSCTNLIVANCPSGDIRSTRPWLFYRLAIDNVDQTGNRDVIWGESIHKNRMERFFKNRGQRFTNSSLRQIACNQLQRANAADPAAPGAGTPNTNGNQVGMYAILETMPITQGTKIVNLELEGFTAFAPQDVIFYKELQKSI